MQLGNYLNPSAMIGLIWGGGLFNFIGIALYYNIHCVIYTKLCISLWFVYFYCLLYCIFSTALYYVCYTVLCVFTCTLYGGMYYSLNVKKYIFFIFLQNIYYGWHCLPTYYWYEIVLSLDSVSKIWVVRP